jgi:hypothetical protein
VRRWFTIAVCAALAPAAHAGAPSNPAFLGIEMTPAPTGCFVHAVTRDGAAAAAGVQQDDLIVAIDREPTASCEQLSARIISHQPGDVVRLDIQRQGVSLALRATLLTRGELLHRQFVGRPLPGTEVIDYDDHHRFELGDLRGSTTVLAWFDLGHCANCNDVIRRVSEAADRTMRVPPRVLALTPGVFDGSHGLPTVATSLGAPLALAPFEFMQKPEIDRVLFLVLDSSGIVRFVTPISPDGEDVDAEIEEVLAAVEQLEHKRR